MLRSLTIGLASLLISGTAIAMADGPGRQGHRNDSNGGPAIVYVTGPGIGYVECPADINEDGQVDVDDLILVIIGYGANANGGELPSDINEDGSVDLFDLLEVIANWGPCPI